MLNPAVILAEGTVIVYKRISVINSTLSMLNGHENRDRRRDRSSKLVSNP